jgi:hypothetical protein
MLKILIVGHAIKVNLNFIMFNDKFNLNKANGKCTLCYSPNLLESNLGYCYDPTKCPAFTYPATTTC